MEAKKNASKRTQSREDRLRPKASRSGGKDDEICREHGISEATLYNWKRKYGGMGVSELRRLRLLEEENRKLKELVADLTLDKHILQEVVKKKL
jgi:putative transposase